MKKNCTLMHKWDRWEQYIETGTEILGRLAPKAAQGQRVQYSEKRQRRTCIRCGKMQDELM